jgi:hypothetical protein
MLPYAIDGRADEFPFLTEYEHRKREAKRIYNRTLPMRERHYDDEEWEEGENQRLAIKAACDFSKVKGRVEHFILTHIPDGRAVNAAKGSIVASAMRERKREVRETRRKAMMKVNASRKGQVIHEEETQHESEPKIMELYQPADKYETPEKLEYVASDDLRARYSIKLC